jgi:hypothetical protein
MYYYSATRVNGRVIKKCHGSGWRGLLAELQVRQRALLRSSNLDARRNYLAGFWVLDNITRLAMQAARQALQATYLLAGFRYSKCHHWLESKELKMEIPRLASLKELPPSTGNSSGPPITTEQVEPQKTPKNNSCWPKSIGETIALVKAGRHDLLDLLRTQLTEVPELWREISDLTRVAIRGWASKISKDDATICESIVLSAMSERDELLGESNTIMERAIVDRFVLAKLQLAYFDVLSSGLDASQSYTKTGIAIEKRYRSAEHQFREATRQLGQIRAIQSKISPPTPSNVSVGIKLHNPDATRKRKLA